MEDPETKVGTNYILPFLPEINILSDDIWKECLQRNGL